MNSTLKQHVQCRSDLLRLKGEREKNWEEISARLVVVAGVAGVSPEVSMLDLIYFQQGLE